MNTSSMFVGNGSDKKVKGLSLSHTCTNTKTHTNKQTSKHKHIHDYPNRSVEQAVLLTESSSSQCFSGIQDEGGMVIGKDRGTAR